MTEGTNPDHRPATPAGTIVTAFHTERQAAWFYRMLAEMTSEDEVRDTLTTLAKDEESHAETLLNLHFEMTGLGITTPKPVQPEGDPNLFDFQASTRREALEFALGNEVKAVELYQKQADSADDPRVATIFRILADTERDHAAYMRLQLERIDQEGAG